MNKLLAITIAALTALFWVLPVMATDPDYYDYYTNIGVTLTTSASDQTNLLVRFPINATAYVESDYVASDWQDVLMREGSTERPPIMQYGGNSWVPLPSLTTAQTKNLTLYTGQNTGAADNPQLLFINNAASSTNDVQFSYPGGNVFWASFLIDDLTVEAYPSTTMPLGASSGGFVLTLSSLGVVTATFTNGGGTCSVTSSALSLDTEYDIDASGKTGNPSGSCTLKINGATVSTDSGMGTGFMSAAGSGRIAGSNTGFRGTFQRWRFGQVDSGFTLPTVIDLQFEPPHMAEAQEGTSGNGWTWKSTIEDQSGNGNDATLTFVQDTSLYTVTVGPVTPLTAYTASTAAETFPTFVSGDPTDPFDGTFDRSGATYGWPLNIFDGLVGDSSKYQMPDLLFSSLVFLVAAFIGTIGPWAATRILGFGVILGGLAGSWVVLITPLPDILVIMVLVMAALSLRVVEEPFTAR